MDTNIASYVWIVVKYWPGGKRETIEGYFSEEGARQAAGRLVGKDGAMVALETVLVHAG
jgi:hypothetical protein